MTSRTLTCWTLTDGRRGMENQALGLAEAIAAGGGLAIEVKRASLTGAHAKMPEVLLASPLTHPLNHLAPGSDSLVPPWPDLLIGCGRTAVGLAVALKKAAEADGHRLFTVQCQDPRISPEHFDLVVAPAHDGLRGENVLTVLGAPHRVTAPRLAEAHKKWADRFATLPAPRIAVLIGGRSKAYDMDPGVADQLCDQLLALQSAKGCGMMITTSRRTGPESQKIIERRLQGEGIWLWDGQGDNPFFGMLAHADHIIVTSDSTNMVTEAASTGKPVHVVHLPGGSKKFDRFHRAMETRGLTRPFAGDLPNWSYEPLNEAARVAPAIRRHMGLDLALPASVPAPEPA